MIDVVPGNDKYDSASLSMLKKQIRLKSDDISVRVN